MHIVSGIKGALFAAALVVLIFFLKIICPLDTGCLADPFLLIIFSPLYLFKITGITALITAGEEPFFILGFWTIMGLIIGYLAAPFFVKKSSSLTEF